MPKEKFLLVSLEEPQAKQLAEVISNETSRKIISHLSEHEDTTETQLAKALKMPLSTIHYNLQKLKEARLVTVEEFHYSKKGREVDHYKLANKYVIITPKPVKGIKTHLRNILPVALVILGISAVIQFVQTLFVGRVAVFEGTREAMVAEAEEEVAMIAAAKATPILAEQVPTMPNIALWFLIGGLAALAIFVLIKMLRKK